MKTKKELLKEYINYILETASLNEAQDLSYSKLDLMSMIRHADTDQFYHIYNNFLDLGFYQDDKRKSKRKFVLDCIENCFEETPENDYNTNQNNEMIKAILDGIHHEEILQNAYKGLTEIAYARDVTHEELNNNPVVLTSFWKDSDGQMQSNTRDFNNLKELFSWVNECGGFRQAFNGMKWSIRSDYKDGEFYLKRDKYARGGWRWTDVNGYNVEHIVRKIRGLRESDYWKELQPAVEQDDYDIKCIEYWKEQIQKGNHRPILVNSEGEILDGNHTMVAYQELGIKPPMLYKGERSDFYPAASKSNWDAMKAIYLMIDDGTATLIESNSNRIKGYRSIGEAELEMLLDGDTIKGRFDSSSENQTSSDSKNVIYFFKDPYMWKDKYHKFMIEAEFDISDTSASTGTYYASDKMRDTRIWTGRRGNTEYKLDEFTVNEYNIDNVTAFISEGPIEELIHSYYNNEYSNELIDRLKNTNKSFKTLNALTEYGEETSEDIEYRELIKIIRMAYPKMDLSKCGIRALKNIAKSAEKKLFQLASEEAEKQKSHPLYKYGKNGEVYIRTDNGGYEKLDESEMLAEANLKDLIDDSKATDPKRIKLAQSIYTEYKGIDSDGTLLFESDSQTRSNKSHKQRIFYDRFFELLDKVDENKEIDANDVVDILTGDLSLDCSCESFLYWAWAYKSWTNNYGLKKELRAPKRNNVALNGGCCKHLLSVLDLINRSDSLFDQIAKDLNDLFQHYRKQAGIVDKPEKKEYIPVDDTQFARTAANLARKGKTNKKLHRNPKAAEYNITPDSE